MEDNNFVENNGIASQKEATQTESLEELNRCKQQYAYLQADFDNYRKRMEAQRGHCSRAAQTEVLTHLLDIVDDFDRAQHDIQNPAFTMIYKAIQKLLTRFNVSEITENTEFNPSIHEAIMQVPHVEGTEAGAVAQVLQKGYRVGSTVLRPAKVAVYEYLI